MADHVEGGFFRLPAHDIVFPHIFIHLDVLEVWRCRAVSHGFMALCNEFLRVTPTLDFRPYRDALQQHTRTFVRILQMSEQLQRFYLRGHNCRSVLPATLADQHQALVTALISRAPPVLKVLSLESVDLHQVHSCMRELARHCTHLEELTLSSVVPFDDESLELVTGECKGLKRVMLRNISAIQGHSLLNLASRCPNLKHLSVSYCNHIKSAHLEQTFKTCPKLVSVDLRYLRIASDRMILIVSEFCGELRSLMVEGCAAVTETTLAPLRQRGVEIDVGYKMKQNRSHGRPYRGRFLRIPGQI